MNIFIALLVPFITALVLYLIFRHRTAWWELSIPLAVSVIFIVVFKIIAVNYISSDTEYLNDAITEVRYYEEWDEWISETCTRSCCCDKDGNNCSIETYDCSYRRYHSEYWEVITTTGWAMTITHDEYNRLVQKFGMKPLFVDMQRDYDIEDGDMYKVIWNGSDEDLECVVKTQSYVNKTQVSKGIYNYPDVTDEEKVNYDLFEYPNINVNHKQNHLLGSDNKIAKHNLEITNARLGPKQQLKAFVLIFDSEQSIDAGYKQRDYWKGGNKNEFIITIGVNQKGGVSWCLPFTWSDDAISEIEIRNFILKQKKMDLPAITEFMNKSLHKFKRKEFSDFDYLRVYPTNTQVIWCMVVTLLINIGLSIWIIKNEFK